MINRSAFNQQKTDSASTSSINYGRHIIAGCLLLFLFFSCIGMWQGQWKVLAIAWIAFVAMAGAAAWGIYAAGQQKMNHLIAGYGLASGAMITSTAIFLIPAAVNYDAVYGGIGIAGGILAGFAIHVFSQQLHHRIILGDGVVLELIAHALTAGFIIGIVYAASPGFSLLLGVAIVSHKAPAGYAAARQLVSQKKSGWLLLLPACAIGLTALPVSLLSVPNYPSLNGLVFGFATGVFFHIAIKFLPEYGLGSAIHQQIPDREFDRDELHHFKYRAVLSTCWGGLIILVFWYISS